jgi:serine/threonine-protein kinase
MPLADGEVFADYTILRVLGSGGMGEVYLAEHPRLPRRDALKVLGAGVSHDEEYRQRFNQEAEMVATLQHPNIVTIFDRGDCDGRLWISMEYVDGTDASRLLTERYPDGIPAAEVVRIVTAVAEALDYAHSRFLLHRDIKPANILIGNPEPGVAPPGGGAGTAGAERIMLADFGVARWVGQTSNLTGTDMTVGTVTYAAPEQLKGEEIDGHADQYALAATAYHLLTGTAPFDNTNPTAVISAHLSAPPPPIGDDNPDLSRFGPVFARALAKNPADRFPRCRDFAEAMQGALDGSDVASWRRRETATPSRRNRSIAAAVGAVLLAGAAIAAMSWLSSHRSGQVRTAPTTPPPPAVSARMDLPVVVIGADCAVLGAAAVDETGAPAYCARGAADTTVWSLQPDTFRPSASPSPTGISVPTTP